MIAFLSQGGYAFFVWGAYGMTLILLVAEILFLRYKRRTILARIGRLIRMRHSGVKQ
ncbi:heme exporter protein CcmD [Thiocapsa imhoffii]|uniref:Heme exporter protein D n=1 Tax=Thiocapsa imhoffii TaxID=382777 RepID=A0A9X0WJD2_9GAMM|nr:heme exporter protein CcmD [Thiocapsa imhoffii]MBK1645626.1 heme exporter protein CcmD [Thiocapsa imhoffii]